MYRVYLETSGNKPLIFWRRFSRRKPSEDLSGVEFVNGTRPGNQELMELAKQQVGNVGGYPYWSWYGFNSRVEWCACFVSWCYNQAGKSEPRFAGCEWRGVPWFQSGDKARISHRATQSFRLGFRRRCRPCGACAWQVGTAAASIPLRAIPATLAR